MNAHRTPYPLKALAAASVAAVLGSAFVVDPKPGFHGDGLLVIAAIAGLSAGLLLALRSRRWAAGAILIGAATLVFAAVQPDSGGFAGVYFVMVLGGAALGRTAGYAICGGTLAGLVAIKLLQGEDLAVVVGLLFSTLPWFLVMRLIRQLGRRRDQAEALVQQLRESRAAHAESAALAERGRVARELHDVLAHSLSALALQLEGTRLLARERGADADVIAGLERAHHLAATGLTESRQAIAALRGDDLPALEDLADAFPGATLTVTGAPRQASSEARLALYRTAQEALTNVRRHSASDRVELRLAYADDGTTLTVQDHGAAPPLANGGGYGLTGMRERAELLGGRLDAGPTNDGFRVELWLPA